MSTVVSIANVPHAVMPIDGSTVGLFVEAGSLRAPNSIGQRSTSDFQVIDEAGTHSYETGLPVMIWDDVTLAVVFAGVITSSIVLQPGQGSLLTHDIGCTDWHYLADKRRAGAIYNNKTAAFIFNDLITNILAAEGVMTTRGVNMLSTQQSSAELPAIAEPVFKIGVGGGGGLTRITTDKVFGTACLRWQADATFGFQYLTIDTNASKFTPGQPYDFSLYLKSLVGTPTLRLYCQADQSLAGNTSLGTVGTAVLTSGWVRYSFTVTMPGSLPYTWIGVRIDTGSPAQAVTVLVDGIQIEPGATATAWEYGGYPASVATGPTITEFLSNYVPVSQCFDSLAQAASYWWQIDAYKVAFFLPFGTITGPPVTADLLERSSVKLTRASPNYRNRQYVLGGSAETTTQVETRVGDGTNTVFAMSYALAHVPTVELQLSGGSFVAKTVGIGGIDSGKDWYWNGGKNEVFQDQAGTKLRGPTGTVDTLRVTYVGSFPTVITSDDTADQADTLAREGAGTGIVEDVVNDSNLSSLAAGFELAAGYLNRFSQLGRQVNFRTDVAGYVQGQLIDVYLPALGVLHQTYLIETVAISHDGLTLWYDVTALVGPVNTNWVTYFTNLMAKTAASVDKINLGSGSSVALLTTFTASRSRSASFTTTVLTCPVFPMVFPPTFC